MSIEERVIEILNSINEDIMTYDGDDLYDAGIIDSMMVIDIVSEIEDEFGIEIDAELVVAENFANKDTILAFVMPILEN